MATIDEMSGVLASANTSPFDLQTAQTLYARLSAALTAQAAAFAASQADNATFRAAFDSYAAGRAASVVSISRGVREIFELISPSAVPDAIIPSQNGHDQTAVLVPLVASASALITSVNGTILATTAAQTALDWAKGNLVAYSAMVAPTLPTGGALGLANTAAAAADAAARTFLQFWRRPPILLSLGSTTGTHGSSDTPNSAVGNDFDPSSIVFANTLPVPTSFASQTLLNFTIPAAQMATAANLKVSVISPTPGGGTSSSLSYQVT